MSLSRVIAYLPFVHLFLVSGGIVQPLLGNPRRVWWALSYLIVRSVRSVFPDVRWRREWMLSRQRYVISRLPIIVHGLFLI